MLYIGITISISLALSTWVLFILLMQQVNGAQFLNITFLSVLFASASATAVLLTDIFFLTSLLTEYVPLDSSFISTQLMF